MVSSTRTVCSLTHGTPAVAAPLRCWDSLGRSPGFGKPVAGRKPGSVYVPVLSNTPSSPASASPASAFPWYSETYSIILLVFEEQPHAGMQWLPMLVSIRFTQRAGEITDCLWAPSLEVLTQQVWGRT